MHTNCFYPLISLRAGRLFKMLLQFDPDVIGIEDGVFGDADEAGFA